MMSLFSFSAIKFQIESGQGKGRGRAGEGQGRVKGRRGRRKEAEGKREEERRKRASKGVAKMEIAKECRKRRKNADSSGFERSIRVPYLRSKALESAKNRTHSRSLFGNLWQS